MVKKFRLLKIKNEVKFMQTVKLNNGTTIPAIGFGVFLIPDDGNVKKQ